jgi:hypothetical protein
MQITWFFGCFFAGYLVFIKFAQITWCVLPGGPDYLVFRKFAQITWYQNLRGDQVIWATFAHKVDQITW